MGVYVTLCNACSVSIHPQCYSMGAAQYSLQWAGSAESIGREGGHVGVYVTPCSVSI